MLSVASRRALSRCGLWCAIATLGVASALVACAGPGLTPTLPSAELTGPLVTEPEIRVSPSASPATPDDSLPPTIVEYQPLPGEEVPDGALLSWRFSEPMDRASVAASLHFSPPMDGQLAWLDDQTLTFRPSELSAGTRYRVTLNTEARSSAGSQMTAPFTYSFVAMSPMEVTRVSPQGGCEDVRTDESILLEFNRPVVPAGCTGEVAVAEGPCVELPLTFAPRLIGSGYWVNPALYRFDVLTGLSAGQLYEVTLADGVTSVEGASLAESFSWSFVTAEPEVLAVQPAPDARDVALDASVSVSFNTPMDQVATGGVFTLVDDNGQPVAGTVAWRDNGALLVFTPTEELMLGTVYQVRLGTGARAATSAPLDEVLSWAFATVAYPELVAYTPSEGASGVDVQEPLRLTFEGAIDERSLLDGIRVSPAPDAEDVYGHYDTQGNSYYLSWDRAARTEYCVDVLEDVVDVYGHPLAAAERFCFETGDLPSIFEPVSAGDSAMLSAGGPLDLHFVARNAGSVSFTLRRLSTTDWMERRVFSGEVVRDWSLPIETPMNSTEAVTVTIDQPPGSVPSGLYSFGWQIAGDSRHSRTLLLAVVDRHVMVKRAVEEALVWVTEIDGSRPISRTAVQLVDHEGLLVSGGTTDDDGVVRLPVAESDSAWRPMGAVVGEPGEPGFGVALTTWQGAAVLGHRLPIQQGSERPYGAYVMTDRPVYKPGQAMRIAGWLRTGGSERHGLPEPGTALTLVLRDLDATAYFTATTETTASGRFETAFGLPVGAPLGDHTLEVRAAHADRDGVTKVASLGFAMVADHEPGYAVTVKADASDIVVGEMARFVVEVDRVNLGPGNGAGVDWAVYAAPVHRSQATRSRATPSRATLSQATALSPTMSWGEDVGQSGGAQVLVARGRGTTDANGRLVIRVPAELASLDETGTHDVQQWIVIATAVDQMGFQVSGMDQIRVHRANVGLTLGLETAIVRARERIVVPIQAVDWWGAGVADQEVVVRLIHQRQDPAAQTGTWEIAAENIAEQTVTTGNDGAGSATFSVLRSGSYVVRAETVDAAGRSAYAEARFAATGEGTSAWPFGEGALTLLSDASRYTVGETAKVLIPVEIEGSYQVLLTVEQDAVLLARRYVFDRPNPVVEVPIDMAYAPEFYISCVVVGPANGAARPDIRVGYAALAVDAQEETIGVEIRPGAATYEPGEDASLVVRAVDAQGSPVDAEFALMLVEASYPLPQRGEGSTIQEVFHGQRPLRVLTGDGFLRAANAVGALSSEDVFMRVDEHQTASGRFAGATVDAGRAGVAPGCVPDVAYWDSRLRTGPTGEVTVTVALPDFLKTWRAVVWAITDGTAVGEARALVPVVSPLVIRPLTPPFLVSGDSLELTASIENNTTEALSAVASLTGEAGIVVTSSTHQRIRLPPGTRRQISWQVEAVHDAEGLVQAVFAVDGGTYHDTARLTDLRTGTNGIPLYRHEARDRPRMSGTVGEGESRVETLIVPDTSGAATALRLQIDASLVAALSNRLALAEPPATGSVDAWVNYVLPAVATYRALQEAEFDVAAFDEAAVLAALDQIYARQNGDGGWGWWQASSDVHLSSYAAYALLRVQEAGLPVQQNAVDAAVQFLEASISVDPAAELDPGAVFGLYVLSKAGRRWPQGLGAALYADRAGWGIGGRAYLALALGALDPSDPRVATLLGEIQAASFMDASGAHWQDADRRVRATDVQVTALVLEALLHVSQEDVSGAEDMVPETVRWLMATRETEPGARGYATAWALTALADVATVSQAGPSTYPWEVRLNGAVVAERGAGTVSGDEADAGGSYVLDLSDADPVALRRGSNVLQVERGIGAGDLYYTAWLDPVLPLDQISGTQRRGMSLMRRYCAADVARGPELQADSLRGCEPVEAVRVGDLVEVRLILTVPETRHFVKIEDRYPSGFEVIIPFEVSSVDPALMPAAVGGTESDGDADASGFHIAEVDRDRILFLADELAPGLYEVAYALRATVPGAFHILPGLAEELYFPDVWAQTEPQLITVVR